jgi:cardiolipin synthase
MLYALAKARARGVDVRILLPEKNDLPLLGVGMHSYFGTLLRAGVGLYLYQPHVLHAKVVVVDDAWATVGSLNFDNVSLRCNLEANLVTTDTKTVGELADPSIEFVQLTDSIEKVSKIVTAGKTPLVAEEDSGSSEILGIITKIDLLTYLGAGK